MQIKTAHTITCLYMKVKCDTSLLNVL